VNVAIACCRRSDDAAADDLEFDRDAAPLQLALADAGVTSTLVSWDDPDADWSTFSKVVVSSTWDSVDRPRDYLAWAARVASTSVLVNPLRALTWGLDKRHQRDLADAGVPTIPTTWVAPDEPWDAPPPFEFVVKPSISAGGRSTARYDREDRRAIGHVAELRQAGQTVMIQPFLPAIDTEGELDLIFITGAFSHAVVKDALLVRGRMAGDRPWEEMAWSGPKVPTSEQLEVADGAARVLTGLLGRCPCYCRIDLVTDADRGPLLLEIELIDPYLSLDTEPSAAPRLADAICSY
jgi:hypothetical protein